MAEFTPFDILSSPLEGTNLIEASAGTGKTYTVAGLFLRLVLEKGFAVSEILVVTFTQAATEELKDRIRSRLREALAAFTRGETGDPFLGVLLQRHGREALSLSRLREALYDFDRAAVFTIHGFCRRMLSEKAFESRSLFDTELVTDLEDLKREIIEDFWRRRFYGASSLFVRYALSRGFSPEGLLAMIGPWASWPGVRIIPEAAPPDPLPLEEDFRDALDEVRRIWQGERDDVLRILDAHEGLNRNLYRRERIPEWAEGMDAFLALESPTPIFFKGFEKLTLGEILRAVKKGHDPPTHPLFGSCDRLRSAGDVLAEVYEQHLISLKRSLYGYLDEELDRRKRAGNIQSFDDLLIRLEGALRGRGGERLSRAVGGIFKAALIDEFQDTDPVQYAIFKRIFGEAGSILFLIGDPKQAIYSFRGADIFAYMEASRDVERRYSLEENWRAEPALIEAVNTLFSARARPFLFEPIPFHPTAPAPRDHERLRIEGDPSAPFSIWFMDGSRYAEPGKPITRTRARETIRRAVAAEISRLLFLARAGGALIGDRPVREGDIAVLVRTHVE
ncbi:MAG: UvrD-helicase domain-containing protein, partial [Deltaproteobacteria bacterium]|nr:UvrD-helicase domain-containing protein [Deltaproteobacteria bacterium]